MRIKNKFKFIRAILLLLFIISILFCKTTFSYKEIEYKTYLIEEGDTLWTIAEELKLSNSYYKNKDTIEKYFKNHNEIILDENNKLILTDLRIFYENDKIKNYDMEGYLLQK